MMRYGNILVVKLGVLGGRCRLVLGPARGGRIKAGPLSL